MTRGNDDGLYGLEIAVSLVAMSETQRIDQPVLLDTDYEGWMFTHKGLILQYRNGVLNVFNGPKPQGFELGPRSIGEMIDWAILTPIEGNRSYLPLTDCPECGVRVWLAQDYICDACRHDLVVTS